MIRNSNLEKTYLIDYDKSKYITINNGEDLNNLTSYGVYCCEGGDIANTLKNCPTGHAFKMIVEALSSDTKIVSQKIVVINNMRLTPYIRTKQSDNVWGSWLQLASKSDLRNIIYSGGVTSTEFDHRQDSGYYILGMYDVINPKTGVTFDIDYTNGQLRLYRTENGVGRFVGRVALQK